MSERKASYSLWVSPLILLGVAVAMLVVLLVRGAIEETERNQRHERCLEAMQVGNQVIAEKVCE